MANVEVLHGDRLRGTAEARAAFYVAHVVSPDGQSLGSGPPFAFGLTLVFCRLCSHHGHPYV